MCLASELMLRAKSVLRVQMLCKMRDLYSIASRSSFYMLIFVMSFIPKRLSSISFQLSLVRFATIARSISKVEKGRDYNSKILYVSKSRNFCAISCLAELCVSALSISEHITSKSTSIVCE